MTDRLLEVTDLHLGFAGIRALDGVGFSVETGELFAIIGPNGAGKTSIFNCLNGVYRPQEGSIRLQGTELIGKRPHRIAGLGVARTFQNIELFENLTVLENILLGRHLHVRYGTLSAMVWFGRAQRQEDLHRERAEEIIDFLEIEAYRKSLVRVLPYGVQKRVELGRALAMDPSLLLLDEPAAGMNLEETEDMARFILDIKEQLGIAMILVEHDMGLVMDIADRIMVLDFGKKIAEGTAAEVQSDREVIRAYLGEEFERGDLKSADVRLTGGGM
ncbi:lipopolysaccharide export system ATP-binding protein LptB [bacterium BMS3Abin02]|nr:lipopolysaccharide export system ATP-binding protein LptB [bacterium BMS3Abin02]HDH26709.1 ABC transporter ATP-binding protein [Actinomycetota bacterium]HDL48676.1 ABC transporter ATP-binding protein [Actinomycetota bacterium]